MIKGRPIGAWGEKIAQEYLNNKGYQIRECNFHSQWGEIDIIAINKLGELTFFEVKTRTNTIYGSPAEAITPKKQSKILKTAYFYLEKYPVFYSAGYAIDALSIFMNFHTRKAKIIHIRNVVREIEL